MPHIPVEITQGCHPNHPGSLDINCDQGTRLYAPRDGICHVRKLSTSYGWYIRLDDGPLSIYLAHLSRFHVENGEKVKAGQLIARSGGLPGTPGAGHSTGDHLHFEVRSYNKHVPCSQVRSYIDSLFHPAEEEDMTPEQAAQLAAVHKMLTESVTPLWPSKLMPAASRLDVAVVELQKDVDAIKAKLGIQ